MLVRHFLQVLRAKKTQKCEKRVKKKKPTKNPSATSSAALERLDLPHFPVCKAERRMTATSQGLCELQCSYSIYFLPTIRAQ